MHRSSKRLKPTFGSFGDLGSLDLPFTALALMVGLARPTIPRVAALSRICLGGLCHLCTNVM